MDKCCICWDTRNRSVPAVAVCNELGRPVCAEHAYWCEQEQHGTRPLETICATK